MTLANRYDNATTTALIIDEGMADYEYECEDYESAALMLEDLLERLDGMHFAYEQGACITADEFRRVEREISRLEEIVGRH